MAEIVPVATAAPVAHAALSTVDPEAYYDVKLAIPVLYLGHQHSPMHRVIIKGTAWPSFKDAVISATKLAPGAETRL
jgi:hypothetical protein